MNSVKVSDRKLKKRKVKDKRFNKSNYYELTEKKRNICSVTVQEKVKDDGIKK